MGIPYFWRFPPPHQSWSPLGNFPTARCSSSSCGATPRSWWPSGNSASVGSITGGWFSHARSTVMPGSSYTLDTAKHFSMDAINILVLKFSKRIEKGSLTWEFVKKKLPCMHLDWSAPCLTKYQHPTKPETPQLICHLASAHRGSSPRCQRPRPCTGPSSTGTSPDGGWSTLKPHNIWIYIYIWCVVKKYAPSKHRFRKV